MSTRDALAHYLTENGFDTKAYTEPTFEVEVFGRHYVFKNTPNRQWAIPLHDLHHVATGYGTDLVGEAEIGVWELMGGCRTPIVYALNIVAVLFGVFLAPLRILRAARDARGARALYRLGYTYEDLLALPLGELRRRLGTPAGGAARTPRRLHDDAERKQAAAHPGKFAPRGKT
jgi:ubiquinone biosynthesis protein Coq4